MQRDYYIQIPRYPTLLDLENAIDLPMAEDPVGIGINGVFMFADHVHANSSGTFRRDLTLNFDYCTGHIDLDGGGYHYHVTPRCLFESLGIPCPHGEDEFWFDEEWEATGPSVIVGWAIDGWPIYGPYDPQGNRVLGSSHVDSPLDACNGMELDSSVSSYAYGYFMTPEAPYTVQCFRSTLDDTTIQHEMTDAVCSARLTSYCEDESCVEEAITQIEDGCPRPWLPMTTLVAIVLFLILFILLIPQVLYLKRRNMWPINQQIWPLVILEGISAHILLLVNVYAYTGYDVNTQVVISLAYVNLTGVFTPKIFRAWRVLQVFLADAFMRDSNVMQDPSPLESKRLVEESVTPSPTPDISPALGNRALDPGKDSDGSHPIALSRFEVTKRAPTFTRSGTLFLQQAKQKARDRTAIKWNRSTSFFTLFVFILALVFVLLVLYVDNLMFLANLYLGIRIALVSFLCIVTVFHAILVARSIDEIDDAAGIRKELLFTGFIAFSDLVVSVYSALTSSDGAIGVVVFWTGWFCILWVFCVSLVWPLYKTYREMKKLEKRAAAKKYTLEALYQD